MTAPRGAALCLLILAGLCSGQEQGTDPRDAKDPRDVADPRTAGDPRGTPVADPYAQLEGRELYEALYKAGDDNRLVLAFKENGWMILGYVDSHCEGWMAMLEQGVDKQPDGAERIAEMQVKGRKLAALADRALLDTRFTAYVESFYSWNADQRKRFREGQDLYRKAEQIISEAETPDAQLAALTPLQQSIERSRPLSDTWGQSMALAAMGRVQQLNGQASSAQATMSEARRLGREIRDISSVWDALAVQYEIAVQGGQYQPAKDALQEQYLIALDLGDEQTQQRVTKQLVDLEKVLAPR